MWKKIIQLGVLLGASLLLVACKNNATYEYHGHAAHHDAQCLALRHEIGTMNHQYNQGWTKNRIETKRRMLWSEYHQLGCP